MPRHQNRSNFIMRGGQRRRETLWFEVPFSETAVDTSGAVLVGVLNAAALALRPFTIVRTRLQVLIKSDQIANNENQFGALGMCIVTEQATAIGVTAVPTPLTDLASDAWFVHQPLIATFALVTAVGIDADGGHQYEVDSKAMRKVEDGFDLAQTVEVSSLSDGTVITAIGRILVKLH